MSDNQRSAPQRTAGTGQAGGGPGGWRGGPAMGMPVEKAKNFRGTLRRLAGYFRPHTGRMLLILLAAVLGTGFSILGPDVLGKAIDVLAVGFRQRLQHVAGGGVDFHALLRMLAWLAILYILNALFGYVQQYMMAGLSQRTLYVLRKQVNDKLSQLPISFFDRRPYGDILSRFVNDFDNIANTLQQSLTQLLTSAITLVGVVVMMLTISPLMTLGIFLTLPLSFVVIRSIAKRSQQYFKRQQKALGLLNGHVEEMYAGHLIVKAFGHEEASIRTFDEINEELYDSGWRAQFVSGIIMPLMNSVANLGFAFVSVLGGIFVTGGLLTVGRIQAFILYARQFSQPITQLSSIANIIQSTIASAERIFELLDEPAEADLSEAFQTLSEPVGDVQFEHVQFGYGPDALLMQDMNIDVKAGQTVAIVGPTGAGKTTVVNLLMRFYEVSGGGITVDGVDIRKFQRGHLRSLFGMVLQDTWLFHGTIRDNIAYGKHGATEDEVVAAARAAHADHFIRTLPDGYDTVLNEEASNISQGQKQLLTIARAFLSNPPMLILDEATSSVDTRTEHQIQKAMSQLMEGRTSFVIAHRLSTIREADWILVMQGGTVIEQGTHQSLLAAAGFYAELYNSQFTSASVSV